MKCSTPVVTISRSAVVEYCASAFRPPLAKTNSRNIGTPMGIPIASAWATEPVRTPRRVIALFTAKDTADKAARQTPSKR
jgi:hypothetical protein